MSARIEKDSKKIKILFFGDSITFGQRISPHLTWVNQIGHMLSNSLGGHNCTVSNYSINGDTTRLALERMPKDVQNEFPDIVHVLFGLNDCNAWKTDLGHPRVSPGAFKANLLEIVDRCKLCGANKVIFSTNHLAAPEGPMESKQSDKMPTSYRERIFEYNELIRGVAKETRSFLIDIESHWASEISSGGLEGDYLEPDGIHLALKGHDFFAGIIGPECLKIINEHFDKSVVSA